MEVIWPAASYVYEIVLPNAFVGEDAELARILLPLWEDPALAGVPRTGGSFWFVTRERRR